MSHTYVKTTYESEGTYASTEIHTLYCHHNHSCDITIFYEEDGSVADMVFGQWSINKNKWDSVRKLWFPFKDEWGGELLDGVEYYHKAPWEK